MRKYFPCKMFFNIQYLLPFVLAATSEVNLLHLEYFWFSVRFLFLQLPLKGVLLEDISDADMFLYRSCKEILNMDVELVDQDVLGLTFVCEVESLCSRRQIELRPNGKDIIVDSKNMEYYVNLLIQHRYITSIIYQVAYNDYEVYESIRIFRIESGLKDVIKEYYCFNIIFYRLIIDSKVLPLFWTKYYDLCRTQINLCMIIY
ncbi:hypothetical protein H5410_003338 [Solanum commersonii]|uniref:HECT-type E3 ubiquitin transferase n=1 Tax=Solanum commersonii TaxID=4109 RepID=A0A9J6B4E4_SOLCO|nr:hypothetical protein H5410_003338 [Solanum commersonii]